MLTFSHPLAYRLSVLAPSLTLCLALTLTVLPAAVEAQESSAAHQDSESYQRAKKRQMVLVAIPITVAGLVVGLIIVTRNKRK